MVKKRIEEFLADERGDTNLISLIITLALVAALVLLFGDSILELFHG